METKPKVLVVGIGAIGGVCAVLMAKAGYNVEVICKYEEVAEKVRTQGLKITGMKGTHLAKLPAKASCTQLEEKKDIVFLATKATDMMQAAEELLPFLKPESVVVSLQNGICEEQLATILGRDRIIGCVVGWAATLLEPAVLEMTSGGEFIIGNIDNQLDSRLPQIQRMLSEVVPVEISTHILANLYSKLIVNACITSLGAICGLYLGEMLAQKNVRRIFLEVMREAVAVADAWGIKIPPYGGKLDYYKLLKGNSWWANFKRHFIIRVIGWKYRKAKSSSLQSLERQKPTEIDYLNGFIVQKGKELNVQTPINALIVETIKEIEQGKRKIGLNNFKEKGFLDLLPN